MFLMTVVFSSFSKIMLSRGISLLVIRKLFSTIGLFGPALSLFLLQYAAGSAALAITLITVAIGSNAATTAGFMINNLDLSPNFAGPVMGLIGGVATFGPIFSPIIAGFIVTDIVCFRYKRFKFSFLRFMRLFLE